MLNILEDLELDVDELEDDEQDTDDILVEELDDDRADELWDEFSEELQNSIPSEYKCKADRISTDITLGNGTFPEISIDNDGSVSIDLGNYFDDIPTIFDLEDIATVEEQLQSCLTFLNDCGDIVAEYERVRGNYVDLFGGNNVD